MSMPRHAIALALFAALASSSASAGFANLGPAASHGGANTGQTPLSLSANPAAVSVNRRQAKETDSLVGGLYFGAGLAYGDTDELFEQYDALAASLSDSDGSTTGIDFDSVDPNNPDFDALINQVEAEAAQVAALLSLVAREGYANADAGTVARFIINSDILGGTLGFDLSYSGSASAQSILDPLNFDAASAKAQLEAAYNLSPGDPITTFDLSGGVAVTIDPSTGQVSGSFTNDSLLAVRAARETTLSLAYSYQLPWADGSLHLGTRAHYVRMGLSRIAPRIGDITDSEQLFDDIRDADLVTTDNISIDLGALWVASHVSLGITAQDIFEPKYRFNDIDSSGYSPHMAAIVESQRSYTQARQLTLEASIYTADRAWALSGTHEVNSSIDALGEAHQWLHLSAGWYSNNFWLPNVRLGYRTNQTGSEISLYSFGVTVLRYINLDLAMATEKVSVEGGSLPRGASASLGFTLAF